MLNVARTYFKKQTEKSNWSGRVGMASLTIGSDEGQIYFDVDGHRLPETSALYLMNFSLQALQDAYAGCESLDEAQAAWGKKYDGLLAGTIGSRGEGGMSDEERAEIYVAENAIREKIGADAWKALDDEARVARTESAIEKLRAAQPDAFAANVAARVEYLVEMRARKQREKATRAALGSVDI